MTITEERRARHLELRERMLQGDNGARWELAMEAANAIAKEAYRGRECPDDAWQDSVLIGYRIVLRWGPEKGGLPTYARRSALELYRRNSARDAVVRLPDQSPRMACRAVYESSFDAGYRSGETPEFESILPSTRQDHSRQEFENTTKLAGLNGDEADIVLALNSGWTVKDCAEQLGRSLSWTHGVGARAAEKLARLGGCCG